MYIGMPRLVDDVTESHVLTLELVQLQALYFAIARSTQLNQKLTLKLGVRLRM
jgi:hypothetical protein